MPCRRADRIPILFVVDGIFYFFFVSFSIAIQFNSWVQYCDMRVCMYEINELLLLFEILLLQFGHTTMNNLAFIVLIIHDSIHTNAYPAKIHYFYIKLSIFFSLAHSKTILEND